MGDGPVLNPDLPAPNSPISSQELRNQFGGIRTELDGTARNPEVDPLYFASGISDPPTQAEVQQIVNKLNQLIDALKR